jgi:hypothetical protein
MAAAHARSTMKVADEVWIVTALLHKENPKREDFTVAEIVERARAESTSGELRSGVQVHAYLHCVANRPPNPGRYRILYATGKNTRRLFREGDDYDLQRRGAKVTPENLPPKYRSLLDWYREKYAKQSKTTKTDPILGLRGLGKEIWVGEEPDEYLNRVRGGWE